MKFPYTLIQFVVIFIYSYRSIIDNDNVGVFRESCFFLKKIGVGKWGGRLQRGESGRSGSLPTELLRFHSENHVGSGDLCFIFFEISFFCDFLYNWFD